MSVENLKEFKDLLDDDFQAAKYANTLLLATNNLYKNAVQEYDSLLDTENELDLTTAMKKIRFNINDAQNKTAHIATQNYDSLIDEFNKIEVFQDRFDTLQVSIEEINRLMHTLNTEFVGNYDQCVVHIKRLQNIHTTLGLMNDLLLFLDSVMKLNTVYTKFAQNYLNKDLNKMQDTEINGLQSAMIRVGTAFHTVNGHTRDKKSVRQLKLYKMYSTSYKVEKVERVSSLCVEIMQSDIGSDLLTTCLITLMVINTNDLLVENFNKWYKHELNLCTNILKRTLVSPKTFESALAKVMDIVTRIITISNILDSLSLLPVDFESHDPYAAARETSDKTTLLSTFLLQNMAVSLSNNQLVTNFFKDLSLGFEDAVSKTVAKGGPVAKNLKNNYEMMSLVIQKLVPMDPIIGKKSLEVVMMKNTLRKLRK